MNISIEEFERRVTVFTKTLPNNPDNKPWSIEEINRVMFKSAPHKIFDPAIELDKHDIHFELKRQFYNDITVAARARAAELRRDRELLKLRTC